MPATAFNMMLLGTIAAEFTLFDILSDTGKKNSQRKEQYSALYLQSLPLCNSY